MRAVDQKDDLPLNVLDALEEINYFEDRQRLDDMHAELELSYQVTIDAVTSTCDHDPKFVARTTGGNDAAICLLCGLAEQTTTSGLYGPLKKVGYDGLTISRRDYLLRRTREERYEYDPDDPPPRKPKLTTIDYY